jgi:hypothetical protein
MAINSVELSGMERRGKPQRAAKVRQVLRNHEMGHMILPLAFLRVPWRFSLSYDGIKTN